MLRFVPRPADAENKTRWNHAALCFGILKVRFLAEKQHIPMPSVQIVTTPHSLFQSE